VYVNECAVEAKVLLGRRIEKGEVIYEDDVIDIDSLFFQGVEFPKDAAFLCVFFACRSPTPLPCKAQITVALRRWLMAARKIRGDARVGNVEKRLGLKPGTIRNPDGSDARSDKRLDTLRKEQRKK